MKCTRHNKGIWGKTWSSIIEVTFHFNIRFEHRATSALRECKETPYLATGLLLIKCDSRWGFYNDLLCSLGTCLVFGTGVVKFEVCFKCFKQNVWLHRALAPYSLIKLLLNCDRCRIFANYLWPYHFWQNCLFWGQFPSSIPRVSH